MLISNVQHVNWYLIFPTIPEISILIKERYGFDCRKDSSQFPGNNVSNKYPFLVHEPNLPSKEAVSSYRGPKMKIEQQNCTFYKFRYRISILSWLRPNMRSFCGEILALINGYQSKVQWLDLPYSSIAIHLKIVKSETHALLKQPVNRLPSRNVVHSLSAIVSSDLRNSVSDVEVRNSPCPNT